MGDFSNPAARLAAIMEQGNTIESPQHVTIANAWKSIFSIDDGDLPTLFRVTGKLCQLPNQIRDAIKSIDAIQGDRYLTWHSRCHDVLQKTNLDANFREVLSIYDSNAIALVRICSDQMQIHSLGENLDLESNAVEKLKADVEIMLEDVLAMGPDELDHTIKTFILHHLTLILDSLRFYPIEGQPSILRGIEASIGHVVLNRDVTQEVKNISISDSFFGLLGRFILIANAWEKAKTIGGDTIKLITDASDTLR